MLDNQIKILLNDVVKGIDYEKVILFGSRARNDFTKESDYDILIIRQNSTPIREKIKLATYLRKKLAKTGIDADIIVKSKDEIEYYKDRIGNVVRSALKEGVVLS